MPNPTHTPKRSRRGSPPHPHTLAGALLLAALLAPSLAAAQDSAPDTAQSPARTSATYGGFIGRVESRQLHSHAEDSKPRRDVVFGGFIEVATPASWLHITLEGSLARRGGDYETGTDGSSTTQTARIDYWSFALLPTAKHDFGRFTLSMSLGFARESDLDTRSTAELAPLFTRPATEVFAVIAAAGIEVPIGQRWSARLEAREHYQLSPAFRPATGDIRHRSREIVLKIGMRR